MAEKPLRVALFITCLTDQFYPRVGIAVTKILEQLGCSVVFPQAQTCCGQPFFNNGFHQEARNLATRFIEIFESSDYIVTPSGSCCAMVREQFHELFRGDVAWEKDAHHVSEKTFEFVEFLTKVLKVDLSDLKLAQPTSMTFHYTCHLRGLGVKDESVRLLRQLGNVEFRPLEKTEQCCGFGGTFAVKYPAISQAMVEDKVQNIAKTKAEVAICNDAGCTMNIAGMCQKTNTPARVTHIAEVIAEAMGLNINDF